MVKEFSIYLKNKSSQLEYILSLAAEKEIDVRAFCILESEEYAIMRAIFDKVDLAKEVLRNGDVIFNINEVLVFLVARVSHPKIKTTIVGLHASKISAICWS